MKPMILSLWIAEIWNQVRKPQLNKITISYSSVNFINQITMCTRWATYRDWCSISIQLVMYNLLHAWCFTAEAKVYKTENSTLPALSIHTMKNSPYGEEGQLLRPPKCPSCLNCLLSKESAQWQQTVGYVVYKSDQFSV